MHDNLGRDLSELVGDLPVHRIRQYTSWSLVAIVAGYSVIAAASLSAPALTSISLVAGALVAMLVRHWENRPPYLLTVGALLAGFATWNLAVIFGESDFEAMSFTVSSALIIYHLRARPIVSLTALVCAIVLLITPPLLVSANGGDDAARSISVAMTWLGAALGAFWLNGYAWRLAMELVAAGNDSKELAVLRERVRFEADLHDLHGHTLHLLRLKLATASRLLVSDAVLASGALEEAKHLIDVALASTRQIAFGEQVIRLDAELANAASLLEAAGIDVEIESLAAPESEVRELFGRLIREATTNVFRHAQAGAVRITISPSSIQISNDGAPAEAGELSGLATLRDRFIESGGDLEVVAHEGIFTVRGTTA